VCYHQISPGCFEAVEGTGRGTNGAGGISPKTWEARWPHFSDDKETLPKHRHGVKNIFLFSSKFLEPAVALGFRLPHPIILSKRRCFSVGMKVAI
jgi:hypothetical protein